MTHLPFIAASYALGVLIPLLFGVAAFTRMGAARRRLAAIDPRDKRPGAGPRDKRPTGTRPVAGSSAAGPRANRAGSGTHRALGNAGGSP